MGISRLIKIHIISFLFYFYLQNYLGTEISSTNFHSRSFHRSFHIALRILLFTDLIDIL